MSDEMYRDDALPIPAEDWEQANTPVGGAFDGQSPAGGIFVVPIGIQTVREVPALAGSSGILAASATGGVGQVFPLVSSDPHRRSIIIGGISGSPRICSSREVAASGGGVPVPAGANPTEFRAAGEMFVYFPTATDVVGFFCMLDQD